MPANFQFGYEHHLYIATLVATPNRPQALDERPGDNNPAQINYNTANWVLFDNVRDVTVGGSGNSVDITTRDEARRGFTAEAIVSTSGTMTFQIRYKPDFEGGGGDPTAEALFYAALKKQEIAMVDLDQAKNVDGSQGLVGNWTLDFSNEKGVQGVVIATVTAKMTSYPDWIKYDLAQTKFLAF